MSGSENSARIFAKSVAIIALLMLSSCGEKKEVYTSGTRGAPADAKPAAPAAADGTPEGAKTAGPISKVGLPSPGGPEDFTKPPAPPTSQPAPVAQTATSPSGPTASAAADPKLPAFTKSASDDLVSSLAAEASSAEDLAAAKTVVAAKIPSIYGAHKLAASLRIKEEGGVKTYILESSDASPAKSGDLQVVPSAGPGLLTTGKKMVSAHISCIEQGNACGTRLMKVKIGAPGAQSTVLVVIREGVADPRFHFSDPAAENPEYQAIKDLAMNSVQPKPGADRIQWALLTTFEVVNGRAGFMAEIRSVNAELLQFAGPLSPAGKDGALNIPLTLASGLKDAAALNEYNGIAINLAQSVLSATLISNDGRGVIGVSAKMRKNADFPQDTFKITFDRKMAPLLPMAQILKM